jgi:hypothetical protein
MLCETQSSVVVKTTDLSAFPQLSGDSALAMCVNPWYTVRYISASNFQVLLIILEKDLSTPMRTPYLIIMTRINIAVNQTCC